ncbi:MAG: DUF4160 domain-containing protein [Eggerthellales bacterium]|nr:DUF4160 domain-containing protein [Eggerthellales bacterium]
MPALARFYGIVIKMYFLQSEHNPPHIHAMYGEEAAVFDIRTGQILDGEIPAKAAGLVREWIALNRDALIEIWQTQEFRKLDPLT